MELEMVADMEVDKVGNKVADRVAGMGADYQRNWPTSSSLLLRAMH